MEQALTLTKEDLKEILRGNSDALIEAVRELKKPTVEEQKKLDAAAEEIKQMQAARLATSDEVKQGIEQKRLNHRMCSHEHDNGRSHCVWIQEKTGPGYILCQKRQCIIRPGLAPKNYQGDHIYDTDMFNRIFQKVNNNEVFA